MGMPNLGQDLRYAIRSLRKSSGFSLMAILTLALGVGANTAVFSLVNAVLLRPLPYHDPGRLVLVWESAPFFGLQDSPVAPANYVDWKARSRSFEEMGAIEDHSFRLTGEGAPEVVDGSFATAGLFRTLRSRPALGRIFRDDEDRPGAAAVAILSDGFWRRRFAGDPAILGKTISLNDRKHTIVGVLAPGTEPPAEYTGAVGDVWTPFGVAYSAAEWADRGRHNWMVIARLRSGVPLANANAEMQAIGSNLAREYPGTNEKVGAFVAPLRDHFVSESRRMLFILLGTVAFVLLIACANLANLLLSRAANRRKEVAVRAALGAGVWHLARQFLCESLLLSAAGSALGLLLATMTFQFLAHLAPGEHDRVKRPGSGLACPGLHTADRCADGPGFWPGSFASGTSPGPEPLAEAERPNASRGHGDPAAARSAHLFRGGASLHAADQRRPADSHLRPLARSRHWFPDAESPYTEHPAIPARRRFREGRGVPG